MFDSSYSCLFTLHNQCFSSIDSCTVFYCDNSLFTVSVWIIAHCLCTMHVPNRLQFLDVVPFIWLDATDKKFNLTSPAKKSFLHFWNETLVPSYCGATCLLSFKDLLTPFNGSLLSCSWWSFPRLDQQTSK